MLFKGSFSVLENFVFKEKKKKKEIFLSSYQYVGSNMNECSNMVFEGTKEEGGGKDS